MYRCPPPLKKNREQVRRTSVHRLGDLRGKGNLMTKIKF